MNPHLLNSAVAQVQNAELNRLAETHRRSAMPGRGARRGGETRLRRFNLGFARLRPAAR
jgi:hypothetical protein